MGKLDCEVVAEIPVCGMVLPFGSDLACIKIGYI